MRNNSGTRATSARLRAAALVALGALCGCGNAAAIRVVEGSTAAHLAFTVARAGEGNRPIPVPQLITVAQTSCTSHEAARRTVWSLVPLAEGQPRPAPARIDYGSVPAGFRSGVAAHPLGPGCYESRVLGGTYWGWVEFRVGDDGSIRELDHSEGGS